MQKDIRSTDLYRDTEQLFRSAYRPGEGLISDASDIHASPDASLAVFTGTLVDKLEGSPPTRICQVDLATGDTQIITSGPNCDRLPKFPHTGQQFAFLSDRKKTGDFQLYLQNRKTNTVTAAPIVQGWVERFDWSTDGQRILLNVTDYGAGGSSEHSYINGQNTDEKLPGWMPQIDTGDKPDGWRSAWILDLTSNKVRQVSPLGLNVWEAVWAGPSAIIAVTSINPREGYWYSNSVLSLIDVSSGDHRTVYSPNDQLGWPSASPSGEQLAVVEAVCSDRGVVAGDLLIIDPKSESIERIDTLGVDVTQTQWHSDTLLQFTGVRVSERVIAYYDTATRQVTQVWVSEEISFSARYPVVAFLGESSRDYLVVGEGFRKAPEIAMICHKESSTGLREKSSAANLDNLYKPLVSFDHGYQTLIAQCISSVDRMSWLAPDGLEIHGWLLQPQGTEPHPLVMHVHGGPVTQWKPFWLARSERNLVNLMLLKQGYAVFLPNPRGSCGQGQAFARKVKGDMGGADSQDLLSGLDYLVAQGIADPNRLGVIGPSYGGFMASWLITQDQRFAAAISVAPVTNWVSLHLTTNVPDWDATYLKGRYNEPSNHYFERSPVMHAHKAITPMLNICGALDCGAPPSQAMEFHNALLQQGVNSVLVTYPEEGHGVCKLPATIDYAARVVSWFDMHMPKKSIA